MHCKNYSLVLCIFLSFNAIAYVSSQEESGKQLLQEKLKEDERPSAYLAPDFYPMDKPKKKEESESGEDTAKKPTGGSKFPLPPPEDKPTPEDKILGMIPDSISHDSVVLSKANKVADLVDAVLETNRKLRTKICTSKACLTKGNKVMADVTSHLKLPPKKEHSEESSKENSEETTEGTIEETELSSNELSEQSLELSEQAQNEQAQAENSEYSEETSGENSTEFTREETEEETTTDGKQVDENGAIEEQTIPERR